ncbi:MAG TPA: iron-sulfur cluster insertion protein ErpA [Buchnera sp. (in: enterobacteria)]|nr:iron-sulfur cluster insertion protein ErpA [Buchnera sp. (in: enterobacteria)]
MNTIKKLPLNITDKATEKIHHVIKTKKNENLKLRIYIIGGGCNGFQYEFMLDSKKNTNDTIIKKSNVYLIIDPISLQYLMGGTIDYKEDLEGSKFIISNPNAKSTCGCGLSFGM